MDWAKSVAIGLAVGAIVSVTPFELFAVVVFLSGGFAFVRLHRAHSEGNSRLVPLILVSVTISVSVAVAAFLSPSSWDDERVERPLERRCVTLSRATAAARFSAEGIPPAALQPEVCFATLQPSHAELEAALNANGIEVRQGRCGNGATLLWGAYVMSADLKMMSR